jgi:hypothetical protein
MSGEPANRTERRAEAARAKREAKRKASSIVKPRSNAVLRAELIRKSLLARLEREDMGDQ